VTCPVHGSGCSCLPEPVDLDPRIKPVTDPDLDAPDGAEIDGYVRRGDQWVKKPRIPPLEERLKDVCPGCGQRSIVEGRCKLCGKNKHGGEVYVGDVRIR
jgi:predicted RNA-binding Zn-ribbon protein involved in translation (DUF1610 family)